MVYMKPKQLKRAHRKAWEAHKGTVLRRWLSARMNILFQRCMKDAGPEWEQVSIQDSTVSGQSYVFVTRRSPVRFRQMAPVETRASPHDGAMLHMHGYTPRRFVTAGK